MMLFAGKVQKNFGKAAAKSPARPPESLSRLYLYILLYSTPHPPCASRRHKSGSGGQPPQVYSMGFSYLAIKSGQTAWKPVFCQGGACHRIFIYEISDFLRIFYFKSRLFQ